MNFSIFLVLFVFVFYSSFYSQETTIFPDDEIFFVVQNSPGSGHVRTFSGTAQTTVFATLFNGEFYEAWQNSNLTYSVNGESGFGLDNWDGWDFYNSQESGYLDSRVFAYGKYKITVNEAYSDVIYIDYRDCNFDGSGAYPGNDLWIKYDDLTNQFYYSLGPSNINNGWLPVANGSTLKFWDLKGITQSITCFNPNPSDLTVANQNSRPYLSWNHNRIDDLTYSYEIYRKFSAQAFQKIAEVQNVNNFTDNEIGIGHRPDLLVYYKIRAKIDDLVSDYSNSASIYYSYLLKDGGKIATSKHDYFLNSNHPNPFNPVTKISYSIPEADFVTLKVYDALGRQVAELVNEIKEAGIYEADFDGSSLSSGIYYYTLTTSNYTQTRKMLLVK